MKNLKKIIFIICIVVFVSIVYYKMGETVRTNSNSEIYATINNDDCILLDEKGSKIILLPKSYYVKILDKIGDYYKVQFKDIFGYVLTEKVELSKTPKQPYPKDFTFNLRFNDYLYNVPHKNSKSIEISKNENLDYIGTITGDELEEYGGNLWYYVKITDKEIYGYVYSYYTTGISGQGNSTEINTKLVNSYEEIKSMPSSIFIIIVVSMCLPIVYIMYLIFLPKIKENISNDKK